MAFANETDYRSASIRAARSLRFDIKNSAEYAGLSPGLQQFMDYQLDATPTILARTPSSIISARQASTAALLGSIQLFVNDLLGRAPQPFLATFAFEAGEVPIGHQLKNTQTMIQKVAAALTEFELEGILAPDIDLILLRNRKEPIVAYHLHGIIFSSRTSTRKVRLKYTSKKLDETINFASRLPQGCSLTGKRPGDPRLHAENMACYCGKIVAAPKMEVGSRADQRFSRDRAFFTPRHAFNQLYAWSQIPICESVIPLGSIGAELHGAWQRKIANPRLRPQSNVFYDPSQIAELWPKVLASINSGKMQAKPLLSI